jgi:hypothetical protein
MKNVTRHFGTLEIIERLPQSRNGNPRYLVSVDGSVCRTAPDSQVAYVLSNFEGKKVEAKIGTHYGVATLADIALA